MYKKLESVSEMQKKIFKKLEVLSGGETINAADESLSYKEKTEINENKDKSNRP